MPHPFAEQLAAAWPPEHWRDVTVIVAVSGGADSVALLRGLMEIREAGEGRLIVAHFNHGLRGPESDRDQLFVEELGRQLALEVVVGQRDGETERQSGASEESLRESRYEFLTRTANQVGARYVATAHTADDQVETVLLNFFRGTGLAGLAGIPKYRPLCAVATLVRPLLDVTRAEVLEYLHQLGQSCREDASNRSLDYTRNRIRHELLPLLERDYNPRVRQAIRRASQLAREAEEQLSSRSWELEDEISKPIAGGIELQTPLLGMLSDYVACAMLQQLWRLQGWPLRDMSLEKWQGLLALIRAHHDAPPETFPGGIRAEKLGELLRLSRPIS